MNKGVISHRIKPSAPGADIVKKIAQAKEMLEQAFNEVKAEEVQVEQHIRLTVFVYSVPVCVM